MTETIQATADRLQFETRKAMDSAMQPYEQKVAMLERDLKVLQQKLSAQGKELSALTRRALRKE